MKIWQKNKENETNELVERFTVGNDQFFDGLLATYDIRGSIAHAKMLGSVGLLEEQEVQALVKELEVQLKQAEAGTFVIEAGVEDVHSQVEKNLIAALGDTGKKIHTGRSRNDQVAVDIKLFLKDKIKEVTQAVKELFDVLIHQSNTYKTVGMPGYTHMQVAMPSSVGLWLGSFAESFVDDLEMLVGAYRIIDKNPLGSGAGYGSVFPLDRQMTTELLGFNTLNWNSINAQYGRGKGEKALAAALSFIASTLSRLSMDCCLFMNENYQFITFPKELTTGSSIMPHKKNPDVFELIRAKCNRIQAVPNELNLLTTNLTTGYHRDIQLTKEILFPAIEDVVDALKMAALMMRNCSVNTEAINDEKYNNLYSVNAINQLIIKGIPFRDAYVSIGQQIENGTFDASSYKADVPEKAHEGSVFRLCNKEIEEAFDEVFNKIGR